MLRNRMMVVLGLLVTVSMILSACGGATATQAPQTQPPQVQPTEAAPTATEAPTSRIVAMSFCEPRSCRLQLSS